AWIGRLTESPTAPDGVPGLLTDSRTFQVKLVLALAPWPSLAVTITEYALAAAVTVPVMVPVVGLMLRPAGRPVAPKVHGSPLGRPPAAMVNGVIVPAAGLVCVPGLVRERTDTFQVKLALALSPSPSLAVTCTVYGEPVTAPVILPVI